MTDEENEMYCKKCPVHNGKDSDPCSEDSSFFENFKLVHQNHLGFQKGRPELTITEQANKVASEIVSDFKKEIDERKEIREKVGERINSNNGILILKKYDIEFDTNSDLLIELEKSFSKTIKRDTDLIYQILFNGLSAFTKEPSHLMVMEKSSEGKTYPALQIAGRFPKNHVWTIGSATPQSFKYEYGSLVDSEYNPIEDKLEEFDEKIIEIFRKIKESNDSKYKESKKEQEKQLKKEKQELMKNSKTLIDFRNKWIIFKEPPDSKLLEALYSTLSSDEEFNEQKFVNKSSSGGNKGFTVVFRGTPSILICTAKDESESKRWQETYSRFNIVSPVSNPDKYRDGMRLIFQSGGLPKEILEQIVISDEEKKRTEAIITYLIKLITSSQGEVFNPFIDPLTEQFPKDSGMRWRQGKRFRTLLNLHTLIYLTHRPKLIINKRKIPIATKSDISWVAERMRNTEMIAPNKLQWFKTVFKNAFLQLQNHRNFGTEYAPDEKQIITGEDIVKYCKEHELGNPTTKTIRENYLNALNEHGFIEKAYDPENKTRYCYYHAVPFDSVNDQSELIDITSINTKSAKEGLEKYLLGNDNIEFKGEAITIEKCVELVISEKNIPDAF